MYIGKQPTVGNFQKCDAITVVNGQAAYTLQVSSTNVTPESANHMLVSLNGVLQAPITSFSIAGSTLTFVSNLATGDVIDFVILLGNVLDIGAPSDGTVTNAKLAQDIISGETALAAIPATDDEFLLSDAGTLKKIDAQFFQNTPFFQATVDGAQTIGTGSSTKMDFNTENFDSDGKFASDRFTPTIAGKYLIHARIKWADEAVEDKAQTTQIFKNGSLVFESSRRTASSSGRDAHVTCVAIVDLDADDYVECYAYHNSGSDADTVSTTTGSIFEGYKLIGI